MWPEQSMVELAFECRDVEPERYGVGPTLLFKLRVTEPTGGRVHAVALRCQIRIDPARRQYTDPEAALLVDVFGDRSRWGDTLKPMQFANVAVMVPSFSGSIDVEMPVPVSYDLEVATGKYFHALEHEPIALTLLFSGTIFGKSDNGFWVEQVPWNSEAAYRMPPSRWRELMDLYFPDSGWLRLRRETIDALTRFKADRGFATWDETMAALVDQEVTL
jgi:hypothetical protein